MQDRVYSLGVKKEYVRDTPAHTALNLNQKTNCCDGFFNGNYWKSHLRDKMYTENKVSKRKNIP